MANICVHSKSNTLNCRSAEFGDLFVLYPETRHFFYRDRGALFEKTEPGLKRENPETKASKMLFRFATSTSKQLL